MDIAYFVTGGIILPLLVCAPVAALENPLATVTNIPYKSEKGEKCFEVVHSATQKYDSLGDRKNLGGKVYEQTRSWRCPNIDPAVDQILKVAHCFQSKGDITKALEQLKLLADEDAYGGCISSEKRNEIEDKINSIRN